MFTLITFHDNGQNFTFWLLNESGHIVDSKPHGQEWLQYKVTDREGLTANSTLRIERKDGIGGVMSLKKFPIKSISMAPDPEQVAQDVAEIVMDKKRRPRIDGILVYRPLKSPTDRVR